MVDWKLGKRQAACALCSRTFEDGEAHISALNVDQGDLARSDTCLACWRKRPDREALLWWRTRHEVGKKRGLALNLEALEALFAQLATRKEVALQELRYVLCLILMRKRRLRVERVDRDDRGEALIVSRPRQSDTFSVVVFDFAPEKIDELRTRLQEVFEGAEGEALQAAPAASSETDESALT